MKRCVVMFAMVLLLALPALVAAEGYDEGLVGAETYVGGLVPEQESADVSGSTESVSEEDVVTSVEISAEEIQDEGVVTSEEQIEPDYETAGSSAQYGTEGGDESLYGP